MMLVTTEACNPVLQATKLFQVSHKTDTKPTERAFRTDSKRRTSPKVVIW